MVGDQVERVGQVQPARDEAHHHNGLHLRLAGLLAAVLLSLLQPAEERMLPLAAFALAPFMAERNLHEVVQEVGEDDPVLSPVDRLLHRHES